MKNITNVNCHSASSYAVLDVELLNANDEYAAYKKQDPRPADLRWPFRRVCAAALMTFTITENGEFEFGHFESWSKGGEAVILRSLFLRLRMLPDYQLVTWGGLSCDLLVIRMGACEHGLRLPKQLVHGARDRGQWLHRDLAVEFKSGSGVHVHMTEIAMRLRLPVKFADQASMVPKLVEEGRWKSLEAIAGADVITTAMLLACHLAAHGEVNGAAAAQIVMLQRVCSLYPEGRHNDYLLRVAKRIADESFRVAPPLPDTSPSKLADDASSFQS